MLVGLRMTSPVITIPPETSLEDALDLMARERIRRLPVTNKHGEMVGIISERDLIKASPSDATSLSVWESKEMMRRIPVERIMCKSVITVAKDTPLEEAARIMADQKIGGLPVVEEGNKVVGIITETDLLKTFLEVMGARVAGVRITVKTPDMPGHLAKLTKAIFDAGGDIASLGTFMSGKTGVGAITMKVSGVDKETLLKVIDPFVLEVMDVREKA